MNDNENDENYQIQIIKQSSYYDTDKLDSTIQTKKKCFSILSTNTQSLNALNIFIHDLKTNNLNLVSSAFRKAGSLIKMPSTISNLTIMSSYHKARVVVPNEALLFIYIKIN